MADVIPLAPHRRPRLPTGPLSGGTADILFFTGVRYERADEPQPRDAVSRPARRAAAPKTANRRKARLPA